MKDVDGDQEVVLSDQLLQQGLDWRMRAAVRVGRIRLVIGRRFM
ncbi:hypothetical protein [Streptomyces sp. BA2]|nr:hypothetical protein [Streptomyces sp. BA2]